MLNRYIQIRKHTMNTILDFWFHTLTPKQQFEKSDDLDALIKEKFLRTYLQVVAGETSSWREKPEGRLAEIIVLDQFARNMFRNTPQAFLYDPLALALAQEAVRCGHDKALDDTRRLFIYMPYMHSESQKIHIEAMQLFKDLPNLEYEIRHKEIIDQFGRYPHRNDVLGRQSTADEVEWLKTNSGF